MFFFLFGIVIRETASSHQISTSSSSHTLISTCFGRLVVEGVVVTVTVLLLVVLVVA
jgi:hypothetical protein